MDYAAAKKLLAGQRLPAVLVDLEAFDRNVALVAGIIKNHSGGHTLRLATKSVRVPELIKRVLDFGPPFRGLMCYSAEEAAWLGEMGFDDFLVAYPTARASDIEALRRLHQSGKFVGLMVDSPAGVAAVSRLLGPVDHPLRLLLDVDMSLRYYGGKVHLGVRRSPLRNLGDVLKLYEFTQSFTNVKLVGIMGYEAQVAGLGDRNPFKRWHGPLFKWVRQRSVGRIAAQRREIAETLTQKGWPLEIFNGGGSGSLNWSVREPWLTELTAGSGFLCSHLFDYFSNIKFRPACFFACQVVRISDPGFVTCQGGGYVASGPAGWDKLPLPYLPQGVKPVAAEGCGEVQTPVQVPMGLNIGLGDPILFRHAKAGELAEHFHEYLLVADGQIVSRAKTYRGLGQCFF